MELIERAKILLKATKDLLEKQEQSSYVLNLLAETVFYDGADCDGYCLKEDIEYWFDELEEQQNQCEQCLKIDKWIPVSKESPTEFARVICCTDEDEIFFATYLGKLDGSDCFDDEEGMMWEGDVIAWMSIPEPYRKEK